MKTIATIIQELESVKPSTYTPGYAGGYIDACDLAIKKLKDYQNQSESEGHQPAEIRPESTA
ncbi:MAG TPA: hypothetical protein VEA37_09485 [Flavobacterium sp.]|nr:hypothetical protein [Flavobacterium sp.]